jgi:diacylglycerol kinase (ATP)
MLKIRFIINPKSGTGKKNILPGLIESILDKKLFDAEISFTQAAGHATQLAKEAVEKNYDIVVAVGGDGSVNETAKSLVHTDTALGIIPTGSGNGMARHLGIPVNPEKAIHLFNNFKFDIIDTLKVNDHFCIGTIGVGFDAHVAHLFANATKRGYSTYVKLVLAEFSSFKEKSFSIIVDGNTYEKDCYLLTFANSSQFGNNALIAPAADVKDGIIEISMIRKFPAFVAPGLIYRLMKNSIHRSKYFSELRGKKVQLKNSTTLKGHIDGEPVIFKNDLNIDVDRLSLKVVVQSLIKK